MKCWAKVKIKEGGNAIEVIRAFFNDFNSESSILIEGNEASLEIVFKDTPMKIIEGLEKCELIAFGYGKAFETEKVDSEELDEEEDAEEVASDEPEEEAEPEEVVSDEPEEEVEPEEVISEEPDEEDETDEVDSEEPDEEDETDEVDSEEPDEEDETDEVDSEEPDEEDETDEVDSEEPDEEDETDEVISEKIEVVENSNYEEIPELTQIANKSSSYNDFVKSVAIWLRLGKRQELFEDLVKAAATATKIKWPNVEANLRLNGGSCNASDKVIMGKLVAEKFKNSESSVTILKLIKVMTEYQNFSFDEGNLFAENLEPAERADTFEEKFTSGVSSNVTTVQAANMDCMPEIPWFEGTLESVDKTWTIEERVRYVLDAMGLEQKSSKEQRDILEIANTAVKLENMSYDNIFLKAKIPMKDTMTARMTFSKFVNDFVQIYDSSKVVKLLDFLGELQKVIIDRSEIKDFDDFEKFDD